VRTDAAILWEVQGEWTVEEIDLDPPKAGEVLVHVAASGLCHSDEHLLTGDLASPLPVIGGHEGAGTVGEVGSGVTALQPGDHVVFSFVPACGRCVPCATGHQNLCDLGEFLQDGTQVDGTFRHHARGADVATFCGLGTFSKATVVNEASCIKIADDLPLEKACLVGCGVTTGWGSAVHAANVRPGENVAVIGIGGIGVNAVQGARLAGAERIVAVDPVEFKREQAVKFGATHTAESIDEAFGLVREITWGTMCDKVILAMGVGRGSLMAGVMALVAKGGRAVVTNIHPDSETEVTMSMIDLTVMEKQVVGSLFGSANPRADIPKLLQLYREGQLNLDDLVTRSYKLEEINQGYQDMRDGKNLRGVLSYV